MFEGITEEPQVLIIDDVLSTRAVLRDMFLEMGLSRVMEASDGDEGLEILKRFGAQLIICDHFMERVSGLQLLKRLKEHVNLSEIPVIFVSGCGDVPTVEAALKLGAEDFLVKPISFKLLHRKVKDLLRRRSASRA